MAKIVKIMETGTVDVRLSERTTGKVTVGLTLRTSFLIGDVCLPPLSGLLCRRRICRSITNLWWDYYPGTANAGLGVVHGLDLTRSPATWLHQADVGAPLTSQVTSKGVQIQGAPLAEKAGNVIRGPHVCVSSLNHVCRSGASLMHWKMRRSKGDWSSAVMTLVR